MNAVQGEETNMARKKAQPKDLANVIEAGTINQSAIQQGSPNATQSATFTVKTKNDLEGIVKNLLASIDKLGLDKKAKAEIKANAKAAQALLATEQPKAGVVRECLSSINDVLKKAAVTVAATEAGKLVNSLIQGINDTLGMG
jgi:hypothetical protein